MDNNESTGNWGLIFRKTCISILGYPCSTDIHITKSLHGYPWLDINVDAHMDNCGCGYFSWIIEDWHPKVMDIHMNNRRFLEIHEWYGYAIWILEPGWIKKEVLFDCSGYFFSFNVLYAKWNIGYSAVSPIKMSTRTDKVGDGSIEKLSVFSGCFWSSRRKGRFT